MTRIIVIGPSHVAAFKTAWDDIAPRFPDVSVAFFGAPMPTFLRMRLSKNLVFGLDAKYARIDDGRWDLVNRINGATSIDLAKADIVMRVGYRVMDEAVLETLVEHDVDGLREAAGPRRLSAPCFDAVLAALAAQSTPPPAWRRWDGRKFVVAARPLPAPSLLEADHLKTPRLETHKRIAERPDGARQALDAFHDKVAAEFAAFDITYLRQPKETITDQCLSEAAFAEGATRITNGKPHSESDHIHLNHRYGELCFERLFQAVGLGGRGRP